MFRPSLIAAAAAAVAALLCGCSRTAPATAAAEAAAAKPTSVSVARPVSVPRADLPLARSTPTAEPSTPEAATWPPVEMQDSDPVMRRFALEQWAREPTESLDLVTAAMVDADEAIRGRAEQIFEEALASRR